MAQRSLDDWLSWARVLDEIYHGELGRSAFSDPEAFVNWTWHWSNGQSPEWIRARIHEGPEATAYRARQNGGGSAPAPNPLGGTMIRVASASDGPFHPRMYSYWSNAWLAEDDRAFVFAGHQDGRPRFFEVNLGTGQVHARSLDVGRHGTTEGWSWHPDGWIGMADGPRLVRVNPFNGAEEVALDIGMTNPGCRLWQAHRSERGQWCATVEEIRSDGPYRRIGTITAPDGRFFPAEGLLDESQITDEFLIIKEDRERGDRMYLDNRIVNLETGAETWLLDEGGAVGHSDCWQGKVVGEDNIIGACTFRDLRTGEHRRLFRTWNMGHVSYRGGRVLLSDSEKLALVNLETGALDVLHGHGVTVTDYDSQVRANLDPTGRVACFMAHGDIKLLVV